MAGHRIKGKFLFLSVLRFSLFVPDFLSFSTRLSFPAVLASQSDPSSNLNPETAKGIVNEEKTDRVNTHDPAFLKEMEKLQGLVQNLTQLVSRLESHFNGCPLKAESLPLVSPSQEEIKIPSKDEILPADELKSGARDAPGTVLKYNTFWSEKFQLVSAVKLRFNPTCLNVLPYKDHDGLSKYFAVGDENGKLLIFSKNGDVSIELDTEYSTVTAMVSAMSVFKNETLIATGHENGIIVVHRVWEGGVDGWNSLHVERLGRCDSPPTGSRITLLEAHQMGRKRYIIASDSGGKLRVLGEDGSLHGSIDAGKPPVAFLRQRLLFLTETGAGSLDLRNMKLKETECEGLNNSLVRNYVFDVVDRTKAYGVTSEGDLVHTLLLGDAMNLKCRVRSKKRHDMEQPVALQAIRGYLLLTDRDKIHLYNVSTQHYVRAVGPRHILSVRHSDILSSFLKQQTAELRYDVVPLVSSDNEKIVVLSLSNGHVAMYRSNLPVFKNEFNSILWTSPVLFFIVFLFVGWHFFANKKDALTSWGPDDPFVSASSSHNSTDLRYAPTRIGSLNSGEAHTDMDMDMDMDPPFLNVTSQLKYRAGPRLQLKRREPFYANNQAVDER